MDSAKSTKSVQSKRNSGLLKALLLVLAGLAINLVFSNLTKLLELPLYIDNVGVIISSVMGGYIPGITTGYLTNAINGISDSSSYYYGTLSVINAVIAAYGAHRGWFKKFHTIILTIILLTISGGVLGSILTWMLYGFDYESAKVFAQHFYDGGMSPFWAQFCSDVIYDVIDKTVTIIFVLILLKLSDILFGLRKVDFSFWHQNVLNEEQIKAVKKSKARKSSLRQKVLILVSVVMIIVALVTAGISFLLYREKLIEDNMDMGTGITNITAELLDTGKIGYYINKNYKDDEYKMILSSMERIARSHGDIKYVYVVRMTPSGYEAVFDADIGDENHWRPGQIIPFQEHFEPYISDALRGEDIPPIVMDDEYGWLLSIFKPVRNEMGQTVCYSCVDIRMSHLLDDEKNFLAKVISLFVGFFIMVLAIFVWLTDYCLVYPINAISITSRNLADKLGGGEKEGAEKIRNLDICTGDEIETLYLAITKMSGDIVQKVADIEEQKDTINNMQNALIHVLANMVENRDKFTGNHVKNTAAYAKIILEELKKKDKYKDIITDDYEYTIINSAPLHDVGKINVPDSLLNKNGRLTDEEFKQMQNHTLAGQNIIDEAANMVKNASYLQEAKNLAAYHHEKWNGTGYPYGLKGEDIPLSARIMAVADVFDALVSRRSYKPGFPIEKALDIIREGSGTHFDPEIAETFLKAEKDVRRVAQENYERDNPDEPAKHEEAAKPEADAKAEGSEKTEEKK